MRPVRRALLSVHDKTGVVELAQALVKHGATVLSTGGTARLLGEGGVEVTAVEDYTGAPEILGGRVKTLHPKIAGGLLAVRGDDAHSADLETHDIGPIDMVVVNLYPFRETVSRAGVTMAEALENIDIGGPTLIRSAAKNHTAVAAVTDPADYPAVIAELDDNGGALSDATRARLARKAFRQTASYDAAIARWLAADEDAERFPERVTVTGDKVQELRYGENPHQQAAFYRTDPFGLGAAHKIQGRELSFNNLVDLDAAIGLARDLGQTSAVIVKHTNPCGAARADSLVEAYTRARATDPLSAFGGVVALTRPVDEATARELKSTFIEAIAAPGFDDAARELLKEKKALRLVELGFDFPLRLAYRQVAGGLLLQDADQAGAEPTRLDVVTKRAPTDAEMRALRFAWVVAKHVKSNAIVYADETQTIGVGAGQMSRVDSARIGADKAELPVRGSVVASDAFFPFRDGVDQLAAAGATAIVQPGGSKRDDEVVAAADEHNLAMVFTGERHFRH